MDAQVTTDVVLQATDLRRVYRVGDVEVAALRGASLTIRRGEFVAIMGSSGSGKSTLMSTLGCLDRPSSGHYVFEGVDVAELSEPELAAIRSERLGFVFQTFNLLPRTSAIENVALPLIYSRIGATNAAERTARARAALTLLGLSDRERNTPGQLSGGQQQRVAIARALINDPSLLLADEPTGNLDTKTSHEIMETLVRLNREQGLTIVLVTHEPDIAAYADRVVTMRDGEAISDICNETPTLGTPLASRAMRRPAAVPAAEGPPLAFFAMVLGAATQALRRNAMRSLLTMLGVFIGVAALIAMVSLGQGANTAVRKQIESLGTNLLVVMPGTVTGAGVRGGQGSASTLTVADVATIRRDAPAVATVSYMIRQMAQTQYADRNWATSIQGVSPEYPDITNWRIAAGRPLNTADEQSAATVALIGQTVYAQLFGQSVNPLGAVIMVRGSPVTVVGVLAPKGQSMMGTDQDDLVMIPFSTAERKVLGVAAPTGQAQSSNGGVVYPPPADPFGLQPRLSGFVNAIFVQAVRGDQVQPAIDQVSKILRRQHRLAPNDVDDFAVRNLSQIAETANGSSRIMAVLLAVVASISLLVGGIGIMNILLVSVTERTREVGLRMAIGARRLHVLLQFLTEAVLLSVTGGAMGVLAGIAAALTIGWATGWPAPIPLAALATGFLFSAAVGIFFGFFPARKAAGLNPIEALRYE